VWSWNVAAKSLKGITADFQRRCPTVDVDVQMMGQNVQTRLLLSLASGTGAPDVTQLQFYEAPRYAATGRLTDLTAVAAKYEDAFPPASWAVCVRDGKIYAIPWDVGPCAVFYKRDIFAKYGIDPDKIETWDDFIAVGKRVTIPDKRYLIEMSDTGSSQLEICLFQRDGGYFDPRGNVIFDNDTAVGTMKWYVPLVAPGSKTRIANTLSSSFGTVIAQGMEQGYFFGVMMPDWRSKIFESEIAPLSGKMALMPLPAVTKGGRRTSTWGGTMLGITRHCKNKDLAWELAKFFYTNEKDLAERFSLTNILPPLRAAWKEPIFDKPNPYWSDEKLGRLYANLAPDVPSQYTHPFINVAKSKFGEALTECSQYYSRHGEDGFDAFVRATLKAKADEVRRQIGRNPY
jgi:ABC-type glycerol-3-phosphate transport system substrate-binding protein